MNKIKFFKTERHAIDYLKLNRLKLKVKGFKPTIQGNAIVLIPRRIRTKKL